MSHSSKKTPWHLRFGAKLKTAAAAVIVGIGLLLSSTAEAQLPDFEIYGIDTTWVHEYSGGQWHETHTAINQVYHSGGFQKGVASYRFAALYQECVQDPRRQTFFMAIDKVKVARTIWYSDGTYCNREHYDEYCAQGQIHRNDWLKGKTDPPPARYLNNKAMVVGMIRSEGGNYQIPHFHLTGVHFTANHTSGEKNFTITIKYRVEGSAEVTTV